MSAPIAVFDPSAPARSGGLRQLKMPDTRQGKVVGFIDNTKPNFSLPADDMAELLKSRYGVAKVVRHRKRVASVPAPEDAPNAPLRRAEARPGARPRRAMCRRPA